MKRIRITLDNLSEAVTAIDDLIGQIQQLPKAMAEKGASTTHYSHGAVSVTASGEKNVGKITATGQDVGFAEYGTGVYAVNTEAPIPTGYGTWSGSADGSGVLINKGYWYYGGVRYVGTPADMAMTSTTEYLKQNASQMAQGIIT